MEILNKVVEDLKELSNVIDFNGLDETIGDEIKRILKYVEEGEGMNKDRKLCKYPMSIFYTYEDEVPENTRVCSMADCESCDEQCEKRVCLITENEGEDTEKEKNCENYCPSCGSDDIDWQCSEDVADYYQEQPGECLKCGCRFKELREIVYKSTIIGE